MKTRRIALTLALAAGLALMTALLLGVWGSNAQAQQVPKAPNSLANIEMEAGNVSGVREPHTAGAAAQQTFTPTWAIEHVDALKNFDGMTDRSLALDSSGNPHIAYGDDHLYYAWYDGSTWHKETVDPAWGVGSNASLKLDGSGNPHISYYDDTNKDLKYASYDGSTWSIQTVDSGGDVGGYTSLALDGSGNPHISYWDTTNRDLKYVSWTGSSWDIQTVDSEGDVGEHTSLALDGSGNPRISYYDGTNEHLKYAWRGRVDTISTTGSAFAAYGTAQFTFPTGAVTDTVVITYTVLQSSGSRPHVGVFFNITAAYSSTGQPAQIAPGYIYTVVIHYNEADIPAGVNESNLALYYWDSSAWMEEPTSMVDTVANTITATPNHFSVWAALAQTDYFVYLPVVLRSYP